MSKYVKEYLRRGLIFGGFGPIILGIVYAFLDRFIDGFSLSGVEVLVAILSTYVMAFVQAGSSVFNQVEEWPLMKSLGLHFLSLYAVYILAYLVNTWLPFEPIVILIFTAVFALIYFIIWLIVYFSVREVGKRLSSRLR